VCSCLVNRMQDKINIKIDNKFLKSFEQLRYLGTLLTNQDFIHENIKSTLNWGNVSYHSMKNLLSSSLLSKNTKNKMY
jgi:hypothetical protein